MSAYIPHTRAEIAAMLARCGAESVADLYSDLPVGVSRSVDYGLGDPMTEDEVRAYFECLAAASEPLTCFAGAGWYDHYAPSAIANLLARSEFLTAYTPYQPEISQGTLRYIFEYQTMMCELTGLDVSNASMYDGSTAVAESMMMCVAATRKRTRFLVSATLNPIYRKVMETYAGYHGITLATVPERGGITDLDALRGMLSAGDVAGVALASPNRYGILEDYTGVADDVHAAKALLVISSPAFDLGMIKTPAEWGADIAAGEAQSLGMPMSFGGPGLGYMCCAKPLMRKLPGRIVGETVDADGRRCYVLTLQAREQHIRRDKATSNICSNQGLMALYAAVYLSLAGAAGLRKAGEWGCNLAHRLAENLCAKGGYALKYPGKPFLNEFAVEAPDAPTLDNLMSMAVEAGILPGVRLDDRTLLIAVTERRTLAETDQLVSIAHRAAQGDVANL